MATLALVRARYRPDGGAERFMQALAETLTRQAALRLTLVAGHWPQNGPLRGALDVVELGVASRLLQSRRRRARAFHDAVSGYLRQRPFDLVQMHEKIPGGDIYRAGDGLHAAWLAEKARLEGPVRGWWTRLDRFHRWQLHHEAATLHHPRLRAIVCISRLVQEDIGRHHPQCLEKTEVIYNGVDYGYFQPVSASDRRFLRLRHGLTADRFTLLFTGSGWQRKGLDSVLRAMAACRHRRDLQLVVVGQDRRQAHYAHLSRALDLQDQVYFAGLQPHPLAFFQLADLFVLPSLYEPFSNAALEALACACPLLVSPRCGVAELVEEGGNGHVRDSLAIAEQAAVIDALLGDALRLAKMREKARETALRFPLARTAMAYNALYQRLLSGGPG